MPRALRPLLLLALLLVAGCPEQFAENRLKVRLPGKPFGIGKAEAYRRAGIYDRFRTSHGVWIVSDGRMVFTLSAACPLDEAGTYVDTMSQQFKCPHCGARFDSYGLPRAPNDQEKSLARCRIEPVDKEAPPRSLELQVNTKLLFRQERNEWSGRFSMHELAGE